MWILPGPGIKRMWILPDPGIKPGLQADSLPSEPPGKSQMYARESKYQWHLVPIYHLFKKTHE